MTRTLLTSSLLLSALLSACASMGDAAAPTRTTDGVLTGPNGMTLYTFDRDAAGSGQSVCNGACATNWPPLVAAAGAKAPAGYSVVRRDDGSAQWAYQGKPLYYWAKDAKPGDRSGDGVNNAWRLARP